MGWLHRLIGGDLQASTPGPTADFWYEPVGALSVTGQRVDAYTAQKISAFYRGVDLLSTALAMLPLNINRRLPNDGGRDVAKGHPLHALLHGKPNAWQDSFRWRRMKMRHLIHKGNAYDFIVPGPRGFVDQLKPIHPDRVTPEQLESGRILYHIKQKGGTSKTYTQDEIFHLCGATDDGVEGKGVLEYARDSLGLALATEGYAARLFGQGAMHGGVLKVQGILNEEASKRMAQSFQAATSGAHNWHRPIVLEQGTEWAATTMTAEDSQFIASRKFSIDDIARWLGVPPHMIGSLERSTNNNIEHQGQEFVTYSLGPWLSLFEFAILDQLILAPETYYAEFVRDALVRGDIATRWTAHVQAVTSGIKTRNEVRVTENLNKLEGLDEPLNPAHITGKQEAEKPKKAKPVPPDDEDDARARAIVTESAARVLRKEVFAAQKAAVKYASDQDAFAAWATDFYEKHVELVTHTLVLSEPIARLYCESQRDDLIAHGLTAAEAWTADYLVGLALDLPRPDPKDVLLKAHP